METRNNLINLFEYDIWANEKTASSIKELENSPAKTSSLLSHIVSAQTIWYNRVLDYSEIPNSWAEFSLEEVLSKSKEINEKWISFLKNLNEKDLDKTIGYKNTRGDKFENTIRDIVIHIINHSTYHRAQIAALIKQSGGQPVVTDYIAFKRRDSKS